MSSRHGELDVGDEKLRALQSEDEPEESDSEDEDDTEGIGAKFNEIRNLFGQQDGSAPDLSSAVQRDEFSAKYGHCLDACTPEDEKTLLHLLVDDARGEALVRYKSLVTYLTSRHPNLLGRKDGQQMTPLYYALFKKREKLVQFILKECKEPSTGMDAVLATSKGQYDNCLHVAIHKGLSVPTMRLLVSHAGDSALCATNEDGKTPLHLAVEYERCTKEGLDVVALLISKCKRALDVRTASPHWFSPYRNYVITRERIHRQKATTERDRRPLREQQSETKAGDEMETRGKDVAGEIQRVSPKYAMYSKPKKNNEGSGDTKYLDLEPRTGTLPRRPTGLHESGGTNVLLAKTAAASKDVELKKSTKKVKQVVTEESANAVRDLLKTHYMRNHSDEETIDFLYGRSQEPKEIYFNLWDLGDHITSEERLKESYGHLKFENILRYVALRNMRIEAPRISGRQAHVIKSDGMGRKDLATVFNFLRNKGVKRIIQVIVDDRDEKLTPPHSDEAIEQSLGGLGVEVWDWRKSDLCTDTIHRAAPEVRDLTLYWSGNNAILRGWYELGGLKQLEELESVTLHYQQGLETTERNERNVQNFVAQMKRTCPGVNVEARREREQRNAESISGAAANRLKQTEESNRWLDCMDTFAEFIQNVKLDPEHGPPERITVALIDDGVDLRNQNLDGKIAWGRSFSKDLSSNLTNPYYVTSAGHGTVMASLICRICPTVSLNVLRLEQHGGQITAESATKAIEAAVDRKVNIISMSWTIERTEDNKHAIQELEDAIGNAAKAGILMFCAANDQGTSRDESFPAASTKKLFKIGGAEATGVASNRVGDTSLVNFLFPGEGVITQRPGSVPVDQCERRTGSSVATALAAGLAALVLYCTQLAARSDNKVTMDHFRKVKGHDGMVQAFKYIGLSEGSKYIEVWRLFEPAAAEPRSGVHFLDVVTKVAETLCTGKRYSPSS